jgi:serine/threonine protein kinase
MENQKPQIYNSANKYAKKPGIDFSNDVLEVHGYQEYVISKSVLLPLDPNLKIKQQILSRYFSPRFMQNRSLLDVGANGGFFSFWAKKNFSNKVYAIDTDSDYLEIVRRVRDELNYNEIQVINSNFINYSAPADNVLALALIHWVYSCTAVFGSLEAVVKKLASLTRYMLIVEWVDPTDDAIQFFHHLDWNKEYINEPYNLELFEKALANNFLSYQKIGNISPTRSIYVAFCTENELDLSFHLPRLMHEKQIISSRLLSSSGGLEYWSILYSQDDYIYKQATFDLAYREGLFLKQLENSYFPKLIELEQKDIYSFIRIEKIKGSQLKKEMSLLCSSPETFYNFSIHCLNILDVLQEKGIIHRDIRPENILIRDRKPVLIDFGWAVSNNSPYYTPEGLGSTYRPPDGSFCDIYSMGKVLEYVHGSHFPVFNEPIALMTSVDPKLRVRKISTLKNIFKVAFSIFQK